MLFIFNETKFLELGLFFIHLATLIYPECRTARALPAASTRLFAVHVFTLHRQVRE